MPSSNCFLMIVPMLCVFAVCERVCFRFGDWMGATDVSIGGAPLVVGQGVPPLELLHSGLGLETGGIGVRGWLR